MTILPDFLLQHQAQRMKWVNSSPLPCLGTIASIVDCAPVPTFSNTLSRQKTWIWDQGCSYPVLGPLSENVLHLSSTSLFSFQSLELSTVLEEGFFYTKLRALRTFKYFHAAAVSRLQVC